MNSKVVLGLKILTMILVSIAFIFYIIAISTDHWQTTKYKVGVHNIGIFSGHSHETQSTYQSLYQYTSSHSGLWNGCATLEGKKICSTLKAQFGKTIISSLINTDL